MSGWVLLLVGVALVNDLALARFAGMSPSIDASRRLALAHALALATGVVLMLGTALSWMVRQWLLGPLGLDYLDMLGFILAIALVVQTSDALLRRRAPQLHRTLGIFLPLVTIDCVVLGTALRGAASSAGPFGAIVPGLGAALGFGLALVMLAAMRERVEHADLPGPLRGAPIALVTAGLMALAFMGFAGMAPG